MLVVQFVSSIKTTMFTVDSPHARTDLFFNPAT